MTEKNTKRGPGTTSVHGAKREPTEGPLVPPIHQTSTFTVAKTADLDAFYEGAREGYIYTRYGNPSFDEAARKIALLENAERCLLTGSGMGAISTAVLALVGSGGRVVSVADTYGGTERLFREVLPRFGVTVDTFRPDDIGALESALEAGPADVVYLESPTNPTLRLVDVEAAARLAREHDAVSVIDNTFATPLNQRPRDLGVDVVLHSATKALNGHSDVSLGAVAADGDVFDRILTQHKFMGATADPFAAWLLDRGLKTLHLRVAQANANARAVAEFLDARDDVANVRYPGLASHPQHALAVKQMHGFGALVTFDVATKEAAYRFADALTVIRNAASLGGAESLVTLPVVQSHRYMTDAARAASGISPGTVRLALGIEDAEDLVDDVRRGLEAAGGA